MDTTFIVTAILCVGIAFLIFFLIKKVIIPQRSASNANMQDKKVINQAIRNAKAAIEKDPQNVEAHYLLGKAFLSDQREELAFREYRTASRMGIEGKNIPEIEFRETLASLYAKFNEEEEALKEYIYLIKKNPSNPEYFYRSGLLFSSRGRADRAEQYHSKAASLNPREGRYRVELGITYYNAKKIAEAGTEFEAALKLNSQDGRALLYMGKVLKDGKNFSAALPFLEKASREQEFKLKALVELGGCYMSLRMLDKAIMELERAVNCIEKDSELDSLYARYFLAMCYERTQEFRKAVGHWEKIYAQKKNFRDVGEKLTQYIDYRQTEGNETRSRK